MIETIMYITAKLGGFSFHSNSYSTTLHRQILLDRNLSKSKNIGSAMGSVQWNDHKFWYQVNDLRSDCSFNGNRLDSAIPIIALGAIGKIIQNVHDSRLAFYDIGANYGTYSTPFLFLNSEIILVEPNPFLAACLRRTYPNGHVLERAFIDINFNEKSIPINILPSASGSSSTTENVSNANDKSFVLDASVIKQDELFEKACPSTTPIIKLDIEGVEASLFRSGFLDFLKQKYKSFVLMCEYETNALSSRESKFLLDALNEFDSIVIHPYTMLNRNNLKQEMKYSINDIIRQNITLRDLLNPRAFAKKGNLMDSIADLPYADIIIFSDSAIYEKCTLIS